MRTVATIVLLLAATAAVGAEYRVEPGGGSQIVFESKAPMESFEGRTDRVRGRAVFDPEDLGAGFEAAFTVETASFDTGIGLRNTHMRENHLHTDRFPTAEFRLEKLHGAAPSRLAAGAAAVLDVEGVLDLHGVTRPLRTEVTLRLRDDGAVEATAEFPVSLAAHDIPRPKFLMLKLADEQLVRATIVARPSGGGEAR